MTLVLDLRQALRSLRRRRGLTLATALILGLGAAAAATMSAVVDQVLLRPLPVRDQDRVVVAWGAFHASSFSHVPLTNATVQAIRERTRVFEQVTALDYNGAWSVVGRAGAEPIPLRIGVVTGGLFGTLGVEPLVGRPITPDDDRVGAAPVAVISRGLWLRRFGGDSAVVGKPLPIWTTLYTVVGVVPGDLELPAGAEAWVPLSVIRPDAVTEDSYGTLDLVGRLRPGATPADAKAELDRLLLETNPDAWNADSRLAAVVSPLSDVIVGRVRPALRVLLGAALLVFLVAALNVAGLLVVRTLEREQEFSVRRALGASRAALVRQVVLEGAMIVAVGVLLGVALAWAALRLIPAVAPGDLPRIGQLDLRLGVVLASLGLGLLGAAIAGALPALSISESRLGHPRGGLAAASERPARARARAAAVAGQAALAIVTVAAALLLVRTLSRLQRLDLGFDPEHLSLVQVAYVSPRVESYVPAIAAMQAILERARAVPGIEHAAAVLQPPLSGTGGYDFGFVTEGQSDAEAAANPYLNYEVATPDYFGTLRTPLLRGRGLSDADRASTPPVVVVTRGLSERMWPGREPLGRRLRWAGDSVWRTVVGVAADARYRDVLELRPSVYVPVGQQEWVPTFLLIRSALPLDALGRAVREAVRAVDPDLAVLNATPMTRLMDRPLAQPRFNAAVLLAFAALAMVLAAVGLYGLVAFFAAQRTREVGIRLAVGALPRQIAAMFLARGLLPVAAGGAVGVLAVLAGGRLLTGVLYGVSPADPIAILGAGLGFATVAVTAAVIPAWRVAGTDPAAALKTE